MIMGITTDVDSNKLTRREKIKDEKKKFSLFIFVIGNDTELVLNSFKMRFSWYLISFCVFFRRNHFDWSFFPFPSSNWIENGMEENTDRQEEQKKF